MLFLQNFSFIFNDIVFTIYQNPLIIILYRIDYIYNFLYNSISLKKDKCHLCWYCSRRYFGLARNLIRCIISPNQDDLSHSNRISFPGSRNWVSCQTQSLWLNNTVQCRRPTGRSSIAAAVWTQEGTYLIYGFLASITETKEFQLYMN